MLRKIDELGRIVLPIEMRNNLKWREKDEIEIIQTLDGIQLNKSISSCIFCDITEGLVLMGRSCVCEVCRKKLAEAKTGDCL